MMMRAAGKRHKVMTGLTDEEEKEEETSLVRWQRMQTPPRTPNTTKSAYTSLSSSTITSTDAAEGVDIILSSNATEGANTTPSTDTAEGANTTIEHPRDKLSSPRVCADHSGIGR
jgi:hypothetical protein